MLCIHICVCLCAHVYTHIHTYTVTRVCICSCACVFPTVSRKRIWVHDSHKDLYTYAQNTPAHTQYRWSLTVQTWSSHKMIYMRIWVHDSHNLNVLLISIFLHPHASECSASAHQHVQSVRIGIFFSCSVCVCVQYIHIDATHVHEYFGQGATECLSVAVG